jgi:hypothetical protein
MPFVKVTRTFPWRGTTYGVGSEIEVPESTAQRMAEARPPFGVIIDTDELEEMTAPAPAEREFTAGALELLAEHEVEPDDYAGEPATGKVTKADVRAWIEA